MNGGETIFGFRLWFLCLVTAVFIGGLLWVNYRSQRETAQLLQTVPSQPVAVITPLAQRLSTQTDPVSLLSLGYALAKADQYDLASLVLARGAELRPASAQIDGLLAWSLAQQLNTEPNLPNRIAVRAAADRAIHDARASDPENGWIQELATDLGQTTTQGQS